MTDPLLTAPPARTGSAQTASAQTDSAQAGSILAGDHQARFVRLLHDQILKLDQAELDFGLYRILNRRRTDIQVCLEQRLLTVLKSAVSGLRNMPTTGGGFFQTAGFYPDFLLGLRRGEAQALAFIDPRGVRQMGLGDEKFQLKQTPEGRRAAFGFHVTSFIAAVNLPEAPFVKGRESSNTEQEELERIASKYHILDQHEAGAHVGRMLEHLRTQL